MAYIAEKPTPPPSADELRARIPGWGADLDPKDRPSFPRERRDLDSGAHWELPEDQTDPGERERSIEHARLTPVFGTAQPLRGVSGAVRRFAYARFSEGRAAHWLLLIAGDRIESGGAHLGSLLSAHPDNPITETGIVAEFSRHGLSSRLSEPRPDLRHAWIDPLLVAGPWILGGVVAARLIRRIARR